METPAIEIEDEDILFEEPIEYEEENPLVLFELEEIDVEIEEDPWDDTTVEFSEDYISHIIETARGDELWREEKKRLQSRVD